MQKSTLKKKIVEKPNYESVPNYKDNPIRNKFGELAFKTHKRPQAFSCRLALYRSWNHSERRGDRFHHCHCGCWGQRVPGWEGSVCRDSNVCLGTRVSKDGKISPVMKLWSEEDGLSEWEGPLNPGELCWVWGVGLLDTPLRLSFLGLLRSATITGCSEALTPGRAVLIT